MNQDLCFLCLEESVLQCENCHIFACTEDHLKVHRNEEKGSQKCFPFRIAKDETRGRFFVATRDIEPLETILCDRPSVIGPSTKSSPVCLECLKILTSNDFVRCSNCNFPMCCNECTLVGVRHSSVECDYLKNYDGVRVKIGVVNPVYACVFVLRMWLLRLSSPKEFDRVDFLMQGITADLEEGEIGRTMQEIIIKEFQVTDMTLKVMTG